METKVSKPDVRFTVINNEERTLFRMIDNDNEKVLYETDCPATIAFLYADYWAYCINVKKIPLSSLSDLAENDKFLLTNIKESLVNFDPLRFLTVFALTEITNYLYFGTRYEKGSRSFKVLKLRKEKNRRKLIDELNSCNTIGDIVNKILEFLGLNKVTNN